MHIIYVMYLSYVKFYINNKIQNVYQLIWVVFLLLMIKKPEHKWSYFKKTCLMHPLTNNNLICLYI